ncbi:MAG: hypothetical protein KF690_00230 [Bacteroidetes bacterium]|nr:hypothetical protein [Bacteroidota bacterium]
MLRFLVILLIIWLSFQLIFMLFGRQIMRFLLKRLTRRIEKNFWEQQNAHQQKYDPNFDREMHLNPDVKIKVPRKDAAKTATPPPPETSGAVQDVDFEEIPD